MDAAPVMGRLLVRQLFKAARDLAQHSGLATSFVVMIALAGTLVLISVLITILVWLRYLVAAGLFTTSAVTAVRWRRGGIEGSRENSHEAPAIDADDLKMLEHDLDAAEPD
ncbi:hypothetical protein MMC22_002483 [Lobaria immixta]|nr:hypothetical protein [Lobaria immixta]